MAFKTYFYSIIASLVSVTAVAQIPAPGASVVVEFNARKITHVQTRGLSDPRTLRAVTADDPVRIASISKLVVALGVMRMVDAGRLDLDRDVSEMLGWRLRNPAFPQTPITLRLLLSHRSSLTDGINYYALPLDTRLQDAVADPKAWDSAHPPGHYFRYTNLNFPVIASVIEAVSGTRFDKEIARLVLRPLKLSGCFNWTICSDATVARAVVLTDGAGAIRRDDLQGKRPACPVVAATDGRCDLSHYVPGTNGALFSPQGGLRISALDLAKIGQMMMRRGRGFLSPAAFKTFATPAWQFDGSNGDTEGGFWCRYAIGVQSIATKADGCNDDPFGDGRMRIGHPGEAYGLRSGLWVDLVSGKGTAYFTTAIADDAPKGRSAFTAAEEALVQAQAQVHK